VATRPAPGLGGHQPPGGVVQTLGDLIGLREKQGLEAAGARLPPPALDPGGGLGAGLDP
jgi:hypothetical protein